jgi:hypothetical protein
MSQYGAHGRLGVLVRDNQGLLRPRAVAVLPFNHYLRGLGEMPGSFAYAALRAQAIAARSYALVAVQTRGQRSGRGRWDGCDCAVYSGVRDQVCAGVRQRGGCTRAALGVGGAPHRVVGGALGRPDCAGVLLASSGGWPSSNAQWKRPAALVPEPARPLGPCRRRPPQPHLDRADLGGLAGRPRRRGHGDLGERGQARLVGRRVSHITVTGVADGAAAASP